MLSHQKVTVDLYYDDSGETFFVLPSGFADKCVVVNESPVDLRAWHVAADAARHQYQPTTGDTE